MSIKKQYCSSAVFQVQLKFSAPAKPDVYVYTVVLRSDSYVGFDTSVKIQVNINPILNNREFTC